MADNSYEQLIDDYENGFLVEPGESLTNYIKRMGGVNYPTKKADGGSIGIEVLFQPKREEYQTGGRTIDSRATTQDFANALKSVSAGTTYQQQADATRYARQQASSMLNEAQRGSAQSRGIENIYNTFFKNKNVTQISPNTFGRSGSGADSNALMYYRSNDRDKILDAMAEQMLNTTSYAAPKPKPKPKTYRTVSPEAQALNMSQSTYQDIINLGKDPRQYYMDYQNRIMQGNPNLLKYEQVLGGPGMMGGLAGPGTAPGATPPTQQQIQQQMQTNPAGYVNFDDLVKQYSSTDPYMNFKEEVRDVVGGRDTGYMSGQDYYDINVLGLDGKGIAEKYGLQYADGGRVGLFMGGDPLTGQALSIYDSMKAYNFSDQEIANALSARGLSELGSTPASETPVTNTATNIINQGGDGGNNSNTLQSFRQDPSVMPAFEALQRNQQLTSMGINDPFANEASLSGAYYGDMPEDTSNQVGVYQPSMMENIKNKIGGTKIGSMFTGVADKLTNNKFVNALGTAASFAKSPLIGGAKMLASGLSGLTNRLPTNSRAINENIAANLGIGVDNIGRIQGDYTTPGGVMSGYGLNQMDADTFDKRTDRISQTLADKYGFTAKEIEDVIDGTYTGKKGYNTIMGKKTNFIRDLRNIGIAKGIILSSKELGLKELERIEKEKADAAAAASYANERQVLDDYFGGSGAKGPTGNRFDGADNIEDYSKDPTSYSGSSKDGGVMGYGGKSGTPRYAQFKNGGLATMFKNKR